MFNTKPPQSQTAARSATECSHIAEGMSLKGNLEGDIDLLLDGRLEGNVRCRSVTIGTTGNVVGRIIAQEAIINGRVEGDIESKTVRLNSSAIMLGNVCHDVIEVEAGAQIEGVYSRIGHKADSTTVVKPAQSAKTDPQKAEIKPAKTPSQIKPAPSSIPKASSEAVADSVSMGRGAKTH